MKKLESKTRNRKKKEIVAVQTSALCLSVSAPLPTTGLYSSFLCFLFLSSPREYKYQHVVQQTTTVNVSASLPLVRAAALVFTASQLSYFSFSFSLVVHDLRWPVPVLWQNSSKNRKRIPPCTWTTLHFRILTHTPECRNFNFYCECLCSFLQPMHTYLQNLHWALVRHLPLICIVEKTTQN